MRNIKDINFEYNIGIYYKRVEDCESHGCEEEGICRCSVIDDLVINDVDYYTVFDKIYKTYFDNSLEAERDSRLNSVLNDITEDLERYTIDRILRHHKIWDVDNWYAKVSPSYYGEEIDFVGLNNIIEINNDILTAISINDFNQRVEFLLYLEYKSILPKLIGVNYKLDLIEKSDIIFGNKKHQKNLDKTDYYSDYQYDSIRGVVLKDGDKYKLIDGYHRISSSDDEIVLCIVAEKSA